MLAASQTRDRRQGKNVESFDGVRVVGTFRGVIQPSVSNPSEPAVTVEEGRFSVIARDAGV